MLLAHGRWSSYLLCLYEIQTDSITQPSHTLHAHTYRLAQTLGDYDQPQRNTHRGQLNNWIRRASLQHNHIMDAYFASDEPLHFDQRAFTPHTCCSQTQACLLPFSEESTTMVASRVHTAEKKTGYPEGSCESEQARQKGEWKDWEVCGRLHNSSAIRRRLSFCLTCVVWTSSTYTHQHNNLKYSIF